MTPKIYEPSPGVFQICGTAASSHVYVLKGSWLTAVVDTGSARRRPELQAGLASLGLTPADVDLVINTHEHFDHVGGNGLFPISTLVAAHHQAARKIMVGDRFVTMLEEEDSPPRVNLLVREGTEFDLGELSLRVVHTPGHTSGSTCLFEPHRGLLFTGDTLFAGGVLSYIAESGSIGDYLASLQVLAGLKIKLLLPAHGRPSTDIEGDLARADASARALLVTHAQPTRLPARERV